MFYATWNAADEFTGLTTDSKIARDAARYEYRGNWKDLAVAQVVADLATEFHQEHYIPVDHGSGHYPRYDVVKVPLVGDEVSYSFNGDTYPDGTVVSVSASLKVVTTSSGRRYFRRRLTGSWVCDGTWSLVGGHRTERNPHF